MKLLKHVSKILKKHMKTLEKAIENICNIQIKYLQHMCETYATSKETHSQHTSEKTAETFGTNPCNIPIYFCNIHMKYLQHTSESSETLEI
jgi:hypothetical protein